MGETVYPPKPEEPLPSDCCDSGCTPCVLDIYNEELQIWNKQCAEIKKHGFILSDNNVEELDQDGVIHTEFYHWYKISDVCQETSNSYLYTFELKKPHHKLPLDVGQHLLMRWTYKNGSITRQYTPVSDRSCCGHFQVAIKIYEDGRMSRYIRDWTIGTEVEWRGPFGGFNYSANQLKNIVLLAAGTGIAPMTQVIQQILNDEEEETGIYLLYSVKTYEDIMCKTLLDEWKDYWNFKAYYFLTQGTAEAVTSKFGESIINGHIDKLQLQTCLDEKLSHAYFCICGTKSFDKDMIKYLDALNIPKERYYKF